MPVILAGNEEQKKNYLGRMTAANADNPLMCVSIDHSWDRERVNLKFIVIEINT